jgi:hypothetical protein
MTTPSKYCVYDIVPIPGREALQRNFTRLANPERASHYSNRRVSLNERFSIINRGYLLVPQPQTLNATRGTETMVVKLILTGANGNDGADDNKKKWTSALADSFGSEVDEHTSSNE